MKKLFFSLFCGAVILVSHINGQDDYSWENEISVDKFREEFLNLCPINEVYQECGSACQPTCQNPDPACNRSCAWGCFCVEGWIRKVKGGKCIQKCPNNPPPRYPWNKYNVNKHFQNKNNSTKA